MVQPWLLTAILAHSSDRGEETHYPASESTISHHSHPNPCFAECFGGTFMSRLNSVCVFKSMGVCMHGWPNAPSYAELSLEPR